MASAEQLGTSGLGLVSEEILCVTLGELTEVYRVRLLDNGDASLERYENGGFLPARVFRREGFEPRDADRRGRLQRAIRHALGYLNGSVSVGERDLLSPTSALTRNLRWFPGDIQMLGTAFHYVRELFPSAQFHVTQLFRRVFADAAFLGLILFTSAFWLRTRAHAGFERLALVLQLASMIAIIGFDRFWEPVRYRWLKLREIRWQGDRLSSLLELPGIVLSQLVLGLAAVAINTMIGLTNLVINPLKIFWSFWQVRRGKALEWKASSVSAGQDMRGWPVSEFIEVYGPTAKVGLGALLFLCWLILLGAPLDLLGLNSFGVFLASFLTAWFYAWYAALPHAVESGKPQYELSRRELWGLTLVGVLGLAVSAGLLAAGLYPVPAFEASTGWVALFLTATSGFAAFFPSYHQAERRRHERIGPSAKSAPRPKLLVGAVLSVAAVLALMPAVRGRAKHFFAADRARFRIPEVELRVYASVGTALKLTRDVDPQPLLRAAGNQLTLRRMAEGPVLDVRGLRGIPSPKPKPMARRDTPVLPELYALPVSERIPTNKPRRDFTLSVAEPYVTPAPAQNERLAAVLAARRNARAMSSRILSAAELAEQVRFVERASFPWIDREELAKLGAADARGARLPLVEMARVHRFQQIKALWDAVPAARQGDVTPAQRFARLLDGIDGAGSLGLEPNEEHVQRFVAAQLEVGERWSREFPNVPLGPVRESVAGAPSGAFQVARHILLYGLSFDQLARRLRLDYVNAHWNDAPIAPHVREAFRDRLEVEERDRLTLDWGDSEEARSRFEGLETEQFIASKILTVALATNLPSLQQLSDVMRLVDGAFAPLRSRERAGIGGALAQMFRVEGADPGGSDTPDAGSDLLRARLWTQTMSGRIAQIASRSGANTPLPGDAEDRELISEISHARYPDDAFDPLQRRALDWLVLIDASETYRELADGYDRFRNELEEQAIAATGPRRAPVIAPEQLWRDLLSVWRELPRHYPAVPARADLVAEFVCQTAYFSSANGKTGRTPAEFMTAFAPVFEAANDAMGKAPPPIVQELTDAAFSKTQGRASRSPEARRFFAWWNVAALARVVQNNFDRHHLAKKARVQDIAEAWGELSRSGLERWPHLPWRVPGFAEYFLNLQLLEGLTLPTLWQRFDRQLSRAEDLSTRHVVPSGAFESLVERRIAEKTGTPNFDPLIRRANATLALAELWDAAARNGLPIDSTGAAKLGDALSLLHEKAAKDYPALYWDGEGIIESYLMLSLVRGWDLYRAVREFDPEWSLANALAAAGVLEQFDELSKRDVAMLTPNDRALRVFIDTQTSRLEKKTGAKPRSSRSTAMNALMALSSLVLSAGEEGQIPMQRGDPWDKERVRRWAGAIDPGPLDRETATWAVGLARDFGTLLSAMRAEGPHFDWENGSTVETELFVARSSGAELQLLRDVRKEAWRVASDLAQRRAALPEAFVELVASDSQSELKRKLAASRGVAVTTVADADVLALEDRELLPQNALLVLSDVLAQIRIAYGEEANPTDVAKRIVAVRQEGPRRLPNVPWSAKGFVESLVVAAERPDFRDDVWKYVTFIDIPMVDALLGEASSRFDHATPAPSCRGELGERDDLPCDVLSDTRAIMIAQTGRTPSSNRVVAFQALRDGLFLMKEFVPEVPPSLDSVIALVRVRALVRALADRFPALHIVASEDHSPRAGFADRLAAIATKQALLTGRRLDDPSFPAAAVQLLEAKFLADMNRIYALVRQSFPEEELQYYEQAIRRDAEQENTRRAQQSGLSANALSVPDVKDDDVVADFALYEVLYAGEIGQGQSYVVTLFEIFNELRNRADMREEYRRGLAALDRQAGAKQPSDPGYEAWQRSSEYAGWFEKRGEFVKRSRGKLIALSRTFALLKQAAFSNSAAPDARAAFARFGGFRAFLREFFDAASLVRHTPGFDTALARLSQQDPFLADGVEFAIAQFKLHVLDRLYPTPEQSAAATRRVASFLPGVQDDYRGGLGFIPGLESGVPFYDAFSSFARTEQQARPGTELLRRLKMVQRGLQSWTQTFVLKQAYKILFDRDLDEDDPATVPADSRLHRILPRTVGDEVGEFLESRLPSLLLRETGTRDLGAWVGWLIENGEVGLDGKPIGRNPYTEAVRNYERRLTHYRERIRTGEASGKSVRAERQRLLDLEGEFDSFNGQVRLVQEIARRSGALYVAASRDYSEALWQSFIWLLVVLTLGTLAALGARNLPKYLRRAGRGLRVAGVALPLALGALPFWIVANPGRANTLAGEPLRAVRLLGPSVNGQTSLRGASAQLAKTRPWSVFSRRAEPGTGVR